MATRFVEVNRETFCKSLEDCGFVKDPESSGELVYIRQHHIDKTMYVKIFTSLPLNGGNTRANGSDAIRVCLIFKNDKTGRSGGLYKAPRVYRTGSEKAVIDRTIERARDAYREANNRLRK